MRKLKLLFAAAALLIGAGSASAYQTPTANGIYYLYNTACTDGTPGFMSSGNGYGFQVVIDNFGFPLKLVSTGTENTYKFQFIHHNGWLSDDGWMYSDGDEAERARTITVQDQGNGTYKLLNTKNSKEIEDWYGNVVGDGTGSRHNYLWQFLSKEERDAMIAGYTTTVKLAAATSMGMPSEIDTESEFDEYLSTNYIGIDQSSKIQNGTFDTSHNTTGWTTHANDNRDFNIGWGNTDPKTTPEVYEGAGYLDQRVTVDKVGLYKVSVNATYRCGNSANNNRIGDLGYDGSVAYLKANNNIAKVPDWYSGKINGNGPDSPSEANSVYFSAGKYITEVYVYVGEEKTIEISLNSPAFTWGGWLMFNNFKLTYYSNQVSDEDANAIISEAEGITSPMQKTISDALATALTTFKENHTIANYNSLTTAIANAQTSVTAYAKAKAYLDEAATILDGTNVYTTDAYATYYSTPKSKYDERTLTTEEANALVKTSTGWHSANTIDDILLSAWTIGGTQCKDFNTSLYINTWSTEGNTDGSNFVTPFFEYWTDDAKSLVATPIVATITGLKASTTYSFTIRARVRQANSLTKIANGITMKVGEGDAVDISAGAQFGTGQFYIGNFSAVGETDAEGKLTCTITVAENSNISWLSFYNAKYTEGEDLSAYIADYEFALSTATTSRDAAAYASVTGKEKADLIAAITANSDVDETNKAALIAAKEALESATNTFVTAAATYTAFVELNKNVATKLNVALPTITTETVAADLDVESYIVAEYTAAKAYSQDYTDKLGEWTNAPGTNKGESWDGTTGDEADTYYDEYNKADRAMTQTVTLPAGDYVLIAKGRGSVNGRLTLTDGTETITFAHKSSTGRGIATDGTATFADGATYANTNGRGWEYRVLTFTSDGETETTLTFNWKTSGSNWCGLDDIELLCNPAVLDYSGLQTAYDELDIPTLGFEKDECAPYNNVDNLNNIAAAKNMLDNQNAALQSEITAATAAITGMTWNANETAVNAIYDGNFTNAPVANATVGVNGWSAAEGLRQLVKSEVDGSIVSTGMYVWGSSAVTYGETTGYTMPLLPNAVYKLTYDRASWSGGSSSHTGITITDPSGTELGVATEDGHAGDWNTTDGTLLSRTIYFATTTAGNYTMTLSPWGNTVYTNMELYKTDEPLEFADGSVPSYVPGNYPSVKITRTLNEGKWATAVYPFAVSGVSGLTIANLDSYNAASGALGFSTTAGASVANKPFLMKSASNKSEISLSNVEVAAAAATPATASEAKLIGTYSQITVTNAEKNYVISDNKIHPAGSTGATINPYRAYIQVEQPGEARALTFFVDGETTGISNLNLSPKSEENVYNLNGQRVNKAQKGVYIINGKKAIVK